MNPEYLQKYYYFERNHWWFLVREKIIRQQLNKSLPANAQLRILNVGAATGRSSQMLQEYGEVISVEKDPDTCIFLREELGLTVVEGSVESLSFDDNVFDVVCAFDVIEHIEQQEQAINELFRVCKNNGVLYCTVPAFHFLWSSHDEVNHHKRRYTMKGIREVVVHKFTVEYSTYFNAFFKESAAPNIDAVGCCTLPGKIFDYSGLLDGFKNGKIMFIIKGKNSIEQSIWGIDIQQYQPDTVFTHYSIYKYGPALVNKAR